jgi:hypothetical protein
VARADPSIDGTAAVTARGHVVQEQQQFFLQNTIKEKS